MRHKVQSDIRESLFVGEVVLSSAKRTHAQSQTEPRITTYEHEERERREVGRLRQYLDEDNHRDFNLDDPQTPEGRLVSPNAPSWYVPDGREGWLRRRSGLRARDVRAGDVGRFKIKDFSTKATSDREHKESLTIPMPPQMLDELSAIVDSKVFPARNAKSLARTLIYEGLQLLHEIARQDNLVIPNSHMQQLELLAQRGRSMAATLAYNDQLEQNCDFVRQLEREGIRNRARVEVFAMLDIVKTLESGELRDRWTTTIRREFGHLLKGRPAKVHVGRDERPAVSTNEDEE